MSKRLFGSFTVPGTGIEFRLYHDTVANNNPYSVYVRYQELSPYGWRKWVNKLVTRYYDYRSCLLCMDNLVNAVYYYGEHKMPHWEPIIPYMTEYIEQNYRPVPKANRKEE